MSERKPAESGPQPPLRGSMGAHEAAAMNLSFLGCFLSWSQAKRLAADVCTERCVESSLLKGVQSCPQEKMLRGPGRGSCYPRRSSSRSALHSDGRAFLGGLMPLTSGLSSTLQFPTLASGVG